MPRDKLVIHCLKNPSKMICFLFLCPLLTVLTRKEHSIVGGSHCVAACNLQLGICEALEVTIRDPVVLDRIVDTSFFQTEFHSHLLLVFVGA